MMEGVTMDETLTFERPRKRLFVALLSLSLLVVGVMVLSLIHI